jgi:uncharacterized protein involved in exopolysaccharide biosynthesis
MSSKLESVPISLASETSGPERLLVPVLAAVWRRKLLVLGIAGAALLLGIAGTVLIPLRYVAQANIRGEVVAPDTLPMQVRNLSAGGLSTGPMSLDLVRVIETQSRLLRSHRLARRVVEQIGLDRLQSLLNRHEWSLGALFKERTKSQEDPLDGAAGALLSGLDVTSDPRAYLITVRYSSADADLSVIVANGFVAELLRSTRLQVLFQERYNAQAQLSTKLAKFGERHPKVAELNEQLTATEASLQRQLRESADTILEAAGENVTKAAGASPSPKRSFILSLSLLLGVLVGMGTALWLERSKWWIA